MNRRDFAKAVGLVLATSFSQGATAQALTPVRLIVLRRLGLSPTNQCVAPCIRGQIFDVSDLTSTPLDQTIVPLVHLRVPVCDVIERPWKDNAANVSSISRGTYTATVRTDATKPWMNTPNKTWRLELAGTVPRSAIQFHYGQDVAWSQGCFIVGTLLQGSDAAGITASYCRVDNGEAAVAAIRAVVEMPGRNANDITIGVADDSGLFANLSPNTPC